MNSKENYPRNIEMRKEHKILVWESDKWRPLGTTLNLVTVFMYVTG